MIEINIEGYSVDEILSLPDEQLDALVLSGEPLVFRAGTAEILGEFQIKAGVWLSSSPKSMAAAKVFCPHSLHSLTDMRSNED